MKPNVRLFSEFRAHDELYAKGGYYADLISSD